MASGALISTGGLKRSSAGKRITGHSGRTVTTDGPFAEAKEVIGGYAVVEAPSLEAAEKIYGVALDPATLEIDEARTAELRAGPATPVEVVIDEQTLTVGLREPD